METGTKRVKSNTLSLWNFFINRTMDNTSRQVFLSWISKEAIKKANDVNFFGNEDQMFEGKIHYPSIEQRQERERGMFDST